MPKLIGIDTGGTYTDAVVFSEAEGVLAKAKALTTRRDLSIGIGDAIDAVMAAANVAASKVAMVSASTTLATNAIVEGLGDRVGLVLIGLAEQDLARAGLGEALAGDQVLFIAGGHNAHGTEATALDLALLPQWIEEHAASASAFAVAGQFSVANPGHELIVRDLIVQRTGKPVTCSHELSAKLNAPKRALTSLLNARLIGIIHHLIDSTEGLLGARSISAPLMVVKGDGSLISAAEARRRPIETILSGPAASLVGACYLTGLADALVADIGGTTTDIALLRDGRPRLNAQGANVGGWSTMIEAVAMHTIGLGGDSDVGHDPRALDAALTLGPRKVIPISLLATQFSDAVHAALDRQMRLPMASEQSGRFALASGRAAAECLSRNAIEAEILAVIAERPVALPDLLATRRHRFALRGLVGRGAVYVAAFCPSDAAHVLGLHGAWDREAAMKAATLFAARRTARGEALAAGAEEISRRVVDTLTRTSAETLLDAAFAEDGDATPRPSAHPLVQAALDRRSAVVRMNIGFSVPIVALGASASTYYPAVADLLNTDAVVPEHADVANAVGAVVGQIRMVSSVTISRPSDALFRAHVEDGPKDFAELADALAFAETWLRGKVTAMARVNGADRVEITVGRETTAAAIGGGEELFLEMRISATGIGRPAVV